MAVKAVGGLKHEDGEIVLEHVSIEYQLKVASASEEAAREAFERHAFSSPIAKSLARSVRIKTKLFIIVDD